MLSLEIDIFFPKNLNSGSVTDRRQKPARSALEIVPIFSRKGTTSTYFLGASKVKPPGLTIHQEVSLFSKKYS